jgi:hypothetical protein
MGRKGSVLAPRFVPDGLADGAGATGAAAESTGGGFGGSPQPATVTINAAIPARHIDLIIGPSPPEGNEWSNGGLEPDPIGSHAPCAISIGVR